MRRAKDRLSDTEVEEGDEDVSAMFCCSVVVQQCECLQAGRGFITRHRNAILLY